MLNQSFKINQSISKLVIGLSLLFVGVGVASCGENTPNSEAENPNQPGQVRDASNEQTQPLNQQPQQTEPQVGGESTIQPDATQLDPTLPGGNEEAKDADKIKSIEEGTTPAVGDDATKLEGSENQANPSENVEGSGN